MIIYINFPFPDVNLTLWMLCLVHIFFGYIVIVCIPCFQTKEESSATKAKIAGENET